LKFWKLASVAIILAISTNVNAASSYYTFEGYIDNFGSDPSGEATSAGLGRFSPVSYTVEIDFSGTGSRTLQDNTTEYLSDSTGNIYGWYSTDYFYASLIESSHPLLSPAISYTVSAGISDDVIESNYGYSSTTTKTVIIDGVSSIGYNYGGSLALVDSLNIQSQHKLIQDWGIGDEVQGLYTYGDWSNDTYTSFGTNLTLTNISPVPLPASIWFFGSGLIGLIGVARRKKA